MKQLILRFVREEEGQDLVEYTLLLAFVCLAAAALFINAGQSLATVWKDTNNIVTIGANCATAAQTAASS
jgi:Flp pilus assembly pilin Flp